MPILTRRGGRLVQTGRQRSSGRRRHPDVVLKNTRTGQTHPPAPAPRRGGERGDSYTVCVCVSCASSLKRRCRLDRRAHPHPKGGSISPDRSAALVRSAQTPRCRVEKHAHRTNASPRSRPPEGGEEGYRSQVPAPPVGGVEGRCCSMGVCGTEVG